MEYIAIEHHFKRLDLGDDICSHRKQANRHALTELAKIRSSDVGRLADLAHDHFSETDGTNKVQSLRLDDTIQRPDRATRGLIPHENARHARVIDGIRALDNNVASFHALHDF